MSDYDNSNTVILFKNDRKETDSHPEYTGTWTDEDGTEYYASCWINQSKTGKKFLKISRGKAKDNERTAIKQEARPEPDDSLPF